MASVPPLVWPCSSVKSTIPDHLQKTILAMLGIEAYKHTIEERRALLLSDSCQWRDYRKYIPTKFLVADQADQAEQVDEDDYLDAFTEAMGRGGHESDESSGPAREDPRRAQESL